MSSDSSFPSFAGTASSSSASAGLYVGRESSVRDAVDVNPANYVECPYDPNHRMPQARYIYHVKNCRAKFRAANPIQAHFKICPWNARHEMEVGSYQQHILRCPDRCRHQRGAVGGPRGAMVV